MKFVRQRDRAATLYTIIRPVALKGYDLYTFPSARRQPFHNHKHQLPPKMAEHGVTHKAM